LFASLTKPGKNGYHARWSEKLKEEAMSGDQPGKSTSLDHVYAEAYRSYLRSLKEGLANLDIDALDLSDIHAPAAIAPFSFGNPAGSALFSFGGQPGKGPAEEESAKQGS
jgi:hypothetical protein